MFIILPFYGNIKSENPLLNTNLSQIYVSIGGYCNGGIVKITDYHFAFSLSCTFYVVWPVAELRLQLQLWLLFQLIVEWTLV